MFHHFHGADFAPGQGSISAPELERLLARISETHTILPAGEYLDRAARAELRPMQVCLSFDDALRCQYEVALPVLRRFGVTAFWFIYTSPLEGRAERVEVYRHFRDTTFADPDAFYREFLRAARARVPERVERALADFDPANYLIDYPFYTEGDRIFRFLRDDVLGREIYEGIMDALLSAYGFSEDRLLGELWMDGEQIRRLADDGHEVGLHSHTHPMTLGRMAPEEQAREYRRNFECLEGASGRAPRSMSHPCNSYSRETLRILEEMGITLGFRADMAAGRFGPLEHPREDHANLMRRLG